MYTCIFNGAMARASKGDGPDRGVSGAVHPRSSAFGLAPQDDGSKVGGYKRKAIGYTTTVSRFAARVTPV